MGELMGADVHAQVALSLYTDFEDFTVFKPAPHHQKSVHDVLDQVIAWGGGLRSLRERQAHAAGGRFGTRRRRLVTL
jgi:hypothetical protein